MNQLNVNRKLATPIQPVYRHEAYWSSQEVAELKARVVAARAARQAPVPRIDGVSQLAFFCAGCSGVSRSHHCWAGELWP